MHISRRVLAVIAGIALLPLLGLLLTGLIAAVTGCEVNEMGSIPCVVMGVDIGDLLSNMLSAGWFGLVTIPFLIMLVGLWSLVEAYVWGRQRRKARRAVR
jgi:hypothetical protein